MSINYTRFAIAASVFIALAPNAFAWKSLGYQTTHERITGHLAGRLDPAAYHDLARSLHLLIGGSSLEDGHERRINGQGKIRDWWDGVSRDDRGGVTAGRPTLRGGVLPNYLTFQFERAYTNLGIMAHLTQDMAVPSHAARIPHSSLLKLPSDGMEVYATAHPDFAPLQAVDNSRAPYDYYGVLQDDTMGNLSKWLNPETGKPYWSASPPRANRLSGFYAEMFGPEGSYGADDGLDSYLLAVESEDPKNPANVVSRTPEIARGQLAKAAAYTKAMLESASKNLPPLVRDLSISGNVLAPGRGMTVSFLPLDNRGMKLAYSVTVAMDGQPPVPVLSGETQLTDLGGYLYETLNPVRLAWDGLVSGKPLPEGSYVLEVVLTDVDGNRVPASVNADNNRENDTKAVFSVVAPATPSGGRLSLEF